MSAGWLAQLTVSAFRRRKTAGYPGKRAYCYAIQNSPIPLWQYPVHVLLRDGQGNLVSWPEWLVTYQVVCRPANPSHC